MGLRRGPRGVSPAISPASRKAPSAIVQGRKGAKAGGRWGEGGLDCQGQTLRVKQDWSWKGKNQETQNIFVIVCSLSRDSGFLFRVQPCLTPFIQFALSLPQNEALPFLPWCQFKLCTTSDLLQLSVMRSSICWTFCNKLIYRLEELAPGFIVRLSTRLVEGQLREEGICRVRLARRLDQCVVRIEATLYRGTG